MFGMLLGALENAVDVVTSPFTGEPVTQKQVLKMLDDGMTIASIASLTGLGVGALQNLIEEG